MKHIPVILNLLLAITLNGQTVLNSPGEARTKSGIDYENIRWTKPQYPHYNVTTFDKELLESDLYGISDFRVVEMVLIDKINAYREVMGRNPLTLNDTGSYVARRYAKELIDKNKFTHNYKSKGPSDRMQQYFPYPVGASENLARKRSNIVPESIDDFTDFVLHGWINSPGHNIVLLAEGNIAAVGIFSEFDSKKQLHVSIAVFSILYPMR